MTTRKRLKVSAAFTARSNSTRINTELILQRVLDLVFPVEAEMAKGKSDVPPGGESKRGIMTKRLWKGQTL
jgi:hypothetical protein